MKLGRYLLKFLLIALVLYFGFYVIGSFREALTVL